MTIRRAIFGLVALVAAVIGWLFLRPGSETLQDNDAGTPPDARILSKTPAPTASPPAEERSHLADTLNSPATEIRADLRVVSELVEAFRSNFPRDGNPVGDNAEITAALTGKNKLRLALIPRDHAAINRTGELCDRWGTPFFFHAESATKMEIRSAGPDKKMWNDDDVVLSP